MRRAFACLLSLLAIVAAVPASAKAPLVLAAASLQESMNAAADAWGAQHHDRPVVSFGGSSALARQIESGAPADLFVSADEDWMNELAAKGLIVAPSRTSFLFNRLVLVAPATNAKHVAVRKGFPLAAMLGEGRLAMADAAVPAGKYGEQALTALGVWGDVAPKVARADNVRGALALVERGVAPYGIVYATDAFASKAVRIVGVFPENTHPLISYPVALLKGGPDAADAEQFRRFLVSGAGKAIFRRYGFVTR
jgi:molybdate transport system substrate-binding protein